MAKSKKARSVFLCQECGHESIRWMGRCPNCGSWNSFVEETIKPAPARPSLGSVAPAGSKPERLRDVEEVEASRLKTGVGEFDRVMGGGIVQGSFTLLAGDPGIGKSTLMTEMGRYLQDRRVLYVTGEESTRQVKLRAKRLGLEGDTVYLYAETNVEEIVAAAGKLDPEVMIVDSIQTVFSPQIQSAPGSVSQVRESASALMQLTKSTGIATFVVGHVTKDGQIAGPRVLEHMVDTVLYFEGDRHHAYRILRTVKNRFGSTNEIGLFEMRSTGLREVNNPSEIFLSERSYGASGSAVVCSLEGTRPILVEIQALVSPATYGTPQRTASGFDSRRLQMLLAVLEKRAGLKVSNQDVFLNAAGGVKLEEPAVDLGAIVAVASSLQDVPADSSTVLIGEVGLGGEVRTVSQIERRLSEASKLGFERVVIPKSGHKGLNVPDGLTVIPVRYVREALDAVL